MTTGILLVQEMEGVVMADRCRGLANMTRCTLLGFFDINGINLREIGLSAVALLYVIYPLI